MNWQSELLANIDHLPKKGIPGRIIVFGENSEPILTGIKEEDVLVAAAELGKGRIACVSHGDYCQNFPEDGGALQKFHENVKKWLTRGVCNENSSIINANSSIINAKDETDQNALKSAKIVYWDGGPAKIDSSHLEEFVRNGGGLFLCMTPWGWLSLNRGKSLADAFYYSLLRNAGLCFTDEHIQVEEDGFSVNHNKARDAHLLRMLSEIEQHPEKVGLKLNVLSRLKYVSEAVRTDLNERTGIVQSLIWQTEILKQIDYLPKKGIPGRIIAFGENSEPILTGSNEEDVLVAAAELGKGRIICVSHGDYCQNFPDGRGPLQKFHENVKKWLTRGVCNENSSIINTKDETDQNALKSAKIVFWDGGPARIDSSNLEEFVRNGGGLFLCMTPWGWLSLNRGKSLADAFYYSLLRNAGLCFTDEHIQVEEDGFSVNQNKASRAHLVRSLKMTEQHPEKAGENLKILSRLKLIPEMVGTYLMKKKELVRSMIWQAEILTQIDRLPQKGIPGRIIAFGENSEPILTGSKEEDVLVAAAELGKGRIVCVSHGDYCQNFPEDGGALQKFHENVKKWLTRGVCDENTTIINAKDESDQNALKSAKIVYWNGGPAKIDSSHLEEFVRNGGGLFLCMTPWGWLSLNRGKSLADAFYYSLLRNAGLCFTDEHIQVEEDGFSVNQNKAKDAHLLRMLSEIEQHPEKVGLKLNVLSRLKYVSEAVRTDLNERTGIVKSLIWQTEILKQIDYLPKKGIPGRIIAFGENSEPILTGSKEEDVLVAAAELGKGRIICVSHGDYCQNFPEDGGALQKFHENVKKWLTRGVCNENSSIINAKDESDQNALKSAGIVLWDGGASRIDSAHLEEFVRNGGGLFLCMTPWGWLRSNRGKSFSEAPYFRLLKRAGLYFTDEYIYANDNQFSVSHNRAIRANLMTVLKTVEQHPHRIGDFAGILRSMKFLPEDVLNNFLPLIKKLWDKCNDILNHRSIPSSSHPISDKMTRSLLTLWLVLFDILDLRDIKAPGVDLFPGDFVELPPLKCYSFEFSSDREEYYFTSCYLPAGKTMKLDILSSNTDKAWQVMIGCHTDVLHRHNNEIRRWPKINRKERLTESTHLLSSAFGGLIYFISPDQPNCKIKVKFDNVADSPNFKLKDGEKGRELWLRNRSAPGLWADIEGELISFTLPSRSVRHLEFDQLTSTMMNWDSVVRLYHDLRGTDAKNFRRQWFVTDEQPSHAYMHAGYPIVTGLDVANPNVKNLFLLDSDTHLKYDRWAAFHEVGHNMQRSWWTFEGTKEVTCNIFTLYAMESICHVKPWIHKWLRGHMTDIEVYLGNGAQYENWKRKPGIALFIYAQLIHAFGWESYKRVFRRYEAMSDNEKPKENQNKIDTWFLIFSEVVQYNLAPLARFWGIGLAVRMTKRMGTDFPVAFLPDDEITDMSPTRVEALLKQFPNLVRTVCPLS